MKKVPRVKCTVVVAHTKVHDLLISATFVATHVRLLRPEAERMSIKLLLFYFNWLLGVQVIMDFYYMCNCKKCKQSSPIWRFSSLYNHGNIINDTTRHKIILSLSTHSPE